MPDLSWRIYYGDGTTFDSDQGAPHQAPNFNVQCVSVTGGTINDVKDVGHFVIHSWQYYLYKPDVGWFGLFTDFDLLDHFIHFAKDIECVLKARTIPHADFKAIYKRAIHDKDFPKKSGWVSNVESPKQNGIFDADEINNTIN